MGICTCQLSSSSHKDKLPNSALRWRVLSRGAAPTIHRVGTINKSKEMLKLENVSPTSQTVFYSSKWATFNLSVNLVDCTAQWKSTCHSEITHMRKEPWERVKDSIQLLSSQMRKTTTVYCLNNYIKCYFLSKLMKVFRMRGLHFDLFYEMKILIILWRAPKLSQHSKI